MSIGISYIDYYVPEEELKISDFIEQCHDEWIPSSFATKQEYGNYLGSNLGLTSIRIETKYSVVQIFDRILADLFAKKNMHRAEIDCIIFAFEEKTALIQEIITRCNLIGIPFLQVSGNECTNIEQACILAKNSLSGDSGMKNILVLTWNKEHELKSRINETYSLTGDAAGVFLYSSIHLLAEQVKSWEFQDDDTDHKSFKSQEAFFMESISVMREFLVESEIDIASVSLHNANILGIARCLVKNNFAYSKVFKNNLTKYGHLNSCDMILNMKDILNESKTGEYILQIGTGSNGSLKIILFQTKH